MHACMGEHNGCGSNAWEEIVVTRCGFTGLLKMESLGATNELNICKVNTYDYCFVTSFFQVHITDVHNSTEMVAAVSQWVIKNKEK